MLRVNRFAKFGRIFALYISRGLIYRLRAFISVLNGALAIFVFPLVWLAALADVSDIAGWHRPEIVTYYVVMGFVFILITPYPEEHMSDDIRTGKVSPWLIRPFTYFQNYFMIELAYRANQLVSLLPITVLVAFLYRDYFVMPRAAPLILMAIAIGVGFVAFFCLSFSIGATAFWLLNAYGVQQMYWFAVLLFGGALVPLEFLPSSLQTIARFLPFQYFHYFPARLYLQQLSRGEIMYGFLALFAWLGVAYGVYKVTWALGVRRYSAVGG